MVGITERLSSIWSLLYEKWRELRSRTIEPFVSWVTDRTIWQFRTLILAGAIAAIGGTMALSGLVLLLLFAVSQAVVSVIAAAASFSTGAVLLIGVYLWITMPTGG